MSDSFLSTSKANTFNSWLMLFQPSFFLRLWVVVRLPLLIAALYFFWPDEFIWLATILAIHLIGTVPERAAIFVLISLILGGSFILAGVLPAKRLRVLAPLGIAFGLFWGLFHWIPGSQPLITALSLTGVLAVNTLSAAWLAGFISKNPGRLIVNLVFGIVIGLSELLLVKPLLLWLPARWQTSKVLQTFEVSLPALILVPGLAAFLLDPYSLSELHRTLWPDPAVHLFARGNFNWLELDLDRRTLYASGFGTNYLQAFNLDALDQPPRQSPVENGYAQGFDYNPSTQELYIYNQLTQELIFLDATTLELKKSVPTPQVSPGDAWLVWDKFSNSIIIASEADEQTGYPFVVIDAATGQVLDTRNEDPGGIALHPVKPWLYLSFFRRDSELLVYDTQLHRLVAKAPTPERLDRIIFAVVGNELELLIPSPADSVILRFNAETLERKEAIKTLFGARAIAVDSIHNLIICGSLVTNRLEVIDLTTQQRIAEYYVGPWQRTITLDSQAGIAYVSTHEGIFKVNYLK